VESSAWESIGRAHGKPPMANWRIWQTGIWRTGYGKPAYGEPVYGEMSYSPWTKLSTWPCHLLKEFLIHGFDPIMRPKWAIVSWVCLGPGQLVFNFMPLTLVQVPLLGSYSSLSSLFQATTSDVMSFCHFPVPHMVIRHSYFTIWASSPYDKLSSLQSSPNLT